jgi:FAD/FMN-containing dehydrogenase
MTLGAVAEELDHHGLVLPMGHCASVGLTGLMLVGGQGVLSRHLGLASDYVGAIELVDHQGRIVVATSSNDFSDYLWLARGGGSGVQHFPGIITAVTLDNLVQRSVPSHKHVFTAFQINYEATVDNAENLLLA